MGMGYNSRKQTEVCLFATTEIPPTRIDCGVRQALTASDDIFAPISRHSAKPKDQYNRIERLYEGPYIELFARERREGWTSLGNEIDGMDINDAIRKINGKSI
jgi:N6-adenosine-specific RNA methylase IME4